MADVKYKDVASFKIGIDAENCETISEIISLADKLVSPLGELARPFTAINDKIATDVIHGHRYWLVELVMDGFNSEALFDEQVQVGAEEPELSTRVLRQGADNDAIDYLIAALTKVGGTDTVTYESGRGILSGLHLHVSNRRGTKYQPCTIRFKVRGNRT